MSSSRNSAKQVIQLPATLDYWEDPDVTDLVDECKGCGLGKGPLVDPLVLADPTQNPETPLVEDDDVLARENGDPWAHLNGQPERCSCTA